MRRWKYRYRTASEPAPPDVALAIYWVMREAQRNAIQHGRARRIKVVLCFVTDGLMVVIEDDGVGFDVDATLPGRPTRDQRRYGHAERAEMRGSMPRIHSTPGEGTRVRPGAPL